MPGVIAHEWLEAVGGAERVVDAFADTFVDAPILTAWNDAPGRYAPGRVREGWLARTPLRRRKAMAVPFLLEYWRQLPAVEAEWVLCSSYLFAHHARLPGPSRDAPKFVYAHSPARYIWEPDLDTRGDSPMARTASIPLRPLDRRRAQEAYKIAAVSAFIAERIARCWGRESTVIHPPVDVATFKAEDGELTGDEERVLDSLPDEFVLGASRFVPYKRLDLAIRAGAAADLPVVLAGDGPEREHLHALADDDPGRVTFVQRPSGPLLRALYRRALVFMFAPVEDFGIMPVEAMATGTPVVANAVGGASETVIDGRTGALFRSTDATELRRAVEAAAATDPDAARDRADEFDGAAFGTRIRDWMGV
jgi:glycosyltransferase involved in cell wall biosynthesis